jgi:hypothetical protein
MAGAGFKTFSAGEVLLASEVNTYLMEQAVMVFAGTAARSSAIASPSEGMITYLSDTNAVEKYTGSAWETLVSSSLNIAQIATGSLSGTSVSLTSLSSYSVLILKLTGVGCASANRLNIRPNGSSSFVYDYHRINQRGSSTFGSFITDENEFFMNEGFTMTGSTNDAIFVFTNCSAPGFTQMEMQSYYISNATDTIESSIGIFKSAAAVSSLEINSNQTWTSGTYTLWGG